MLPQARTSTKAHCAVLCVLALALSAHCEVLFSDSFEDTGRLQWRNTWGKAERSQDFAQHGAWSIKETLEDEHGLSVWYVEFPTYPKATYRATAWVYAPSQEKAALPVLSLNALNWRTLVADSTEKTDEWVKLEVEYEVAGEPHLRLQLFQQAQGAGLGGAVMYWDNVVVEREIGEISLDDGMRINPYVREGLDVVPAGGMAVRVSPGKIDVGGQQVTVAEETVLQISPPRTIEVRDEQAQLTDDEPAGYGTGTPLLGCRSRGTTLEGTLDPESLVIKAEAGPAGRRLEGGTDWRADKAWGRVGRLPDGEISGDSVVFIDYDYSLMRLDTIEVRSDGRVVLRVGAEHKMCPEPPQADMHARPLCNIFLPYHCDEIAREHIYPIGPPFPDPAQDEVEQKAALIPESLRKLTSGERFVLLFWGDSVTCGGDASSQAAAFPQAFTAWLRNRYPQANVEYVSAGTGGWNSNMKLPLFQEEVIDRKPDLVIIEFVNDMGMSRENMFSNCAEAVTRIREIGGEVIIITPHFVRPDWMGPAGMRTGETRPPVGYIKEFAAANNVGLADASRRWAHLWVEGIPYITLLFNGINHPDDRGHQLFVEELQRLFP